MWISKQDFLDLIKDKAMADGRAHELDKQVSVLQTSIDWMKIRVNQLEQERVALTYHATGAKLSAPEIVRTDFGENPMLQLPTDFEDVGDELAGKLGLYHNSDGTLTTTKPATRLEEMKAS